MNNLTIIGAIEQSVRKYGQDIALIDNDKPISYQQLYAAVCHSAESLHKEGISSGDVVALSLGHSALHAILILAVASLGAVSVSIDRGLTKPIKNKMIRKFGIKFFVADRDVTILDEVKHVKIDALRLEKRSYGLDFVDYKVKESDPFRITLSSGTTGDPKGVLFSHEYMLDRIAKTMTEAPGRIRLVPMDMNMSIGCVFMLGVLINGGTVVFPKSHQPSDIAAAITRHQVTHIFLSPAIAMAIVKTLPSDEGLAFPHITHLRLGGASASANLLATLRQRFTPNIYLAYGLSEIGGVSLASLDSLTQWPGSAGKVKHWVKVEAVDESGKVLPPGQSGELRIRLEPLPEGYWNDDAKTAKAFRDGWFYSGDRGRVNEQGVLFIEGRMDVSFNVNGNHVDPLDIEKIVMQHPQVLEAAVFPLDVDDDSKILALAVIRKPGTGKLQLKEYCNEQFGWRAPKQFFIMDDFPRTPSGKVLRDKLPDMARNAIDQAMAKQQQDATKLN